MREGIVSCWCFTGSQPVGSPQGYGEGQDTTGAGPCINVQRAGQGHGASMAPLLTVGVTLPWTSRSATS